MKTKVDKANALIYALINETVTFEQQRKEIAKKLKIKTWEVYELFSILRGAGRINNFGKIINPTPFDKKENIIQYKNKGGIFPVNKKGKNVKGKVTALLQKGEKITFEEEFPQTITVTITGPESFIKDLFRKV
jgi:hypothetical protein